jgi:acyl-CoA thioesterase-1
MRKHVQLCVMFGFFVTACGEPTTTIHEPVNVPAPSEISEVTVNTGQTIVMLGDSLTAGFGLSPEQALPAQIQIQLRDEFTNIEIINAGVSGDTTANGLARYDWSVTAAKPDLVIVALGANDYLMGLSPELAKSNLGKILKKAKENGHEAVLAGIAGSNSANVSQRDTEYANIFPVLAAEFNVPLYPALMNGVRGKNGLLQADGLHPTAEGVIIMATGLAEFIEPYIPETSEE